MASSSSSEFKQDICSIFKTLHSLLNGLEYKIYQREDLLMQKAQEEVLNQLSSAYTQILSSPLDINSFLYMFTNKLKKLEQRSPYVNSESMAAYGDIVYGCKPFDSLSTGTINSPLELSRHFEEDEKPKDMTKNASLQDDDDEDAEKSQSLNLSSDSSKAYDSANVNDLVSCRNSVIKNPVSIVVPIDPREYLVNSSEQVKSGSGIIEATKVDACKSALMSNNSTSFLFNRLNLQLGSSAGGNLKVNPGALKNSHIHSALSSEQSYDLSGNSNDVKRSKNFKDRQALVSESISRIPQLTRADDKIGMNNGIYENANSSDGMSKISFNRVKENRCPMCFQQFTQLNSLKRHIRSHTGERPFPCEYCEKRFVDRERLKVHIRIHTGEKPFSCSLCNRAFSQKSTVKRHMSVHTGLKPFQCSVDNCFKKFGTRDNLKMHERKTHNKVTSNSSDSLQTGKVSSHRYPATSPDSNLSYPQVDGANDLSIQSSCDSNMV